MIPVGLITEKELEKRFDSLPQKIQSALTSEASIGVANNVCDNNRIVDEEKKLIVHQLVGLTMLGFVHYYDVGSEIAEATGLDKRVAGQIAQELEVKIFNPIKTELEGNYHPLIADEKKLVRPEESPKLIEEIKPPVPVETPKGGTPTINPSWMQPEKQSGPVDISKMFTSTPFSAVKTEEKKGVTPPPMAPVKSPAGGPMGEFARFGFGGKPGGTINPPTSSQPSHGFGGQAGNAEVGPKILHEEERVKPGVASGFRMDTPTPKFSEMKSEKTAPPRPATIGFGVPTPPLPFIASAKEEKPSAAASRVVNYSDLRTPLTEESGKWKVESGKTQIKPEETTPELRRFTFGAKKTELPVPTQTPRSYIPASTPAPEQGSVRSVANSTDNKNLGSQLLGDEKMMHGDKPPVPPVPPPIKPRIEPPPVPPKL